MPGSLVHRFLFIALVLATVAPSLHAQDSLVALEIRARIEQLRATGTLRVAGENLTQGAALAALYEQRAFMPAWTDAAACADLLAAAADLARDGLDPLDYHGDAIRSHAALVRAPSADREAELDLLRSHALLRMADHLVHGKAPATPPPPDAQAAARQAGQLLATGRPGSAVLGLRPGHFVYRGLMDALDALRAVEREGGWPVIPAGPTMRRDSIDPRVPLLRHRLRIAGDLVADDAAGGHRLDVPLERAVRSFQHRHGLNEDGVVGPATLAELNVPVSGRIAQVRTSLERVRWIAPRLGDDYVAVNIAGAVAWYVRGGTVVFESRVIVGAPYTRTPIFSASMRYIDLNPTWTVPPGIVGEVLDHIRRDPSYLQRNGMRVLDASGRTVDASRIDFSRYSARTFPWVFRQDPGPLNPLGVIKFMFPNDHNVYLHDTPSRDLFERDQRLFSHGCIRLQDPIRLAELILADLGGWDRDALQQAIATGRNRTVHLARPLPVHVLYWTASADLHGELHFHRDVYDRDADLLTALDAPPRR
ncbi:MAG TPA: L,D-transpeptidase family protein [Longimicrobiales bacterium]|nr:L,D-transpeptidase family protein [Longimicrobiales bacterium]